MVISGKRVATFKEANYATLVKKYVDKAWEPASTNESWDVFWRELTYWDGEVVGLSRVDGEHEIQSDTHGEYIELRQEHNSIFASGEYLTRFRPFNESSTETKDWMEE